METVGPPTDDVELHLLTEWSDPRGRSGVAGIASVLLHAAVLTLVVLLPGSFLASPPEPVRAPPHVTPLVEPLTEFTQPTPTKGKISREIDMAALQPRPSIQAPRAAPSTHQPMAQRPAPLPTPPQPPPAALPEPPKLEAIVREAPKIELPPTNTDVPAPPPTVQKPKLALENVGGPPPLPSAQGKVVIPNTSVAEAIRQNSRGGAASGGLMVGDPGAGSGGYGEGINLPPSPGAQGSALELKSDPMGVDFRPYLTQILATIRRNWFAVMPESVKLGRHGKVGLLFAITKSGNVSKVTWAFQSGADALDKAAVAAISASNPFPPLPAEFKGERVVLQLNFAYNVPKQ
jgi:TonB family protein